MTIEERLESIEKDVKETNEIARLLLRNYNIDRLKENMKVIQDIMDSTHRLKITKLPANFLMEKYNENISIDNESGEVTVKGSWDV